MRESLFSPLWYRVARRRPHFRRDVKVRQIQYRGQIWHVLINEATGQQHRASQTAYEFIGRCDGLHTVQEIWDFLLERLGDDAPTQDEVIKLLIHLDEQGILAYESAPEAGTLVRRREERMQQKRKGMLNPFAFRVPLGNPSRFLKSIEWLGRPLVNIRVLFACATLVGIALLAVFSYWPMLKSAAMENLGTPHFLVLLWICFPFVKALHELAHALVVTRWGGEVREFGFTLFLLVPAPYVDASDSGGFRHRSQRVFVSAAGIIAELALASVALFFWLIVQPGLIQDALFVIMFIASVSTLLFNGNPLLPFDAYYILTDVIDVPNLSSRSKKFWNNYLRRMLMGSTGTIPEYVAAGERKWLLGYFPLSMCYRMLIFGAIIVWVGSKSVMLGVAAACFVAGAFILVPLWRTLKEIFKSARTQGKRARSWIVTAVMVAAMFLMTCVIPMPNSTLAYGVVWLPEKSKVRAKTGGFVSKILARNGEYVEEGRALVILEDPALLAERDVITEKLRRAETERYSAIGSNSEQVQKVENEIDRLRADLARANEKIANLEIRSGVSGRLVMPEQQDVVGTFVRQGGTLGYVFRDENISVRAAVPEYDATLVREDLRNVSVRISDRPEDVFTARLVRDVPAATQELPSLALGERGGGPFVTDQSQVDGLHVVEPVVLFDVTVPDKTLERAGGRAWVRFEHSAKPLVGQWYRRARQVFLKRFNPVG